MPHHHPNVYRFIEIVKKIETSDSAKLSQLEFGAAPPSRKRVYREMENRVSRLKEQLLNGVKTPIQFLDAVSCVIKLY